MKKLTSIQKLAILAIVAFITLFTVAETTAHLGELHSATITVISVLVIGGITYKLMQ